MIVLVIIALTLAAAFIASISQLFFKRGVHGSMTMKSVIKSVFKKGVLLGLFGYFISLVIYLYALSKGELSLVYPIFASSFIFTTLLSAFVLRERITLHRALGILLVFVGITIIAISA